MYFLVLRLSSTGASRCMQGAGTLVAALNTFIDTRAIAVGVHEFGQQKQRLIALPKQDAAANGEAQQQLQPVVANELVTITPVQLDPAHVEIGSAEEGAAALPPAGKRAKTEPGAIRNGNGGPLSAVNFWQQG